LRLPGHPPWAAQAHAARATIELARGRIAEAASSARSAMHALEAAMVEDMSFDVYLPVARAIAAGGTAEEVERITEYLRLNLALIAQRTFDSDIRARWFRGPVGAELVRLVGGVAPSPKDAASSSISSDDAELLEQLVAGRTDREIADDIGVTEAEAASRMRQLFARIGTKTRAEATAFAFREVV
jgi:DNA-binding NarL/FixJ family response regulator